MDFQWKKVENCFADSKTFEYRLPVAGEAFIPRLISYRVKVNDKFRRPLFTAENGEGIRVRGILREPIVKVSFPERNWEEAKAAFEKWLEELPEEGL